MTSGRAREWETAGTALNVPTGNISFPVAVDPRLATGRKAIEIFILPVRIRCLEAKSSVVSLHNFVLQIQRSAAVLTFALRLISRFPRHSMYLLRDSMKELLIADGDGG
jgi:hypothetical protein